MDVEVLLPPDRARPARPRGDRAAARSDLLGSDPSLDGLPELIRERTGGNPFFIEELVQALVEAGSLEGERGAYRLARPVEEAAVPASVQAVLAARIDRLAQREKAVLQAAAVIGKEFPAPVLERVVELEPAELEDALRNLVAGEFVYEQELYPEALYAFKHPLTQEVAYGSQLGERRAAVHAAVARAIAEHYPERLDERAALLAQHWEAAGETLEAARWHARAAAWSGTSDPTAGAAALAQGARARRRAARIGGDRGARPHGEDLVAAATAGASASRTRRRRRVFNEAERMASRAGDVRVAGDPALELRRRQGHRRRRRCASTPSSRRQAIALAEESGDPALYMAVVRLGLRPLLHRRVPRGRGDAAIARSSWRTATPPSGPGIT